MGVSSIGFEDGGLIEKAQSPQTLILGALIWVNGPMGAISLILPPPDGTLAFISENLATLKRFLQDIVSMQYSFFQFAIDSIDNQKHHVG